MKAALEVERKFDARADASMPTLARVPGVGSVSPAVEQHLEATYFDTSDLRLREAGITLRYRTGGTDAGWHLKLPMGIDREEVQVQGPAAAVPGELAALLRAQVRGRPLAPVAQLSTARTVRHLLSRTGEVLVELADDLVTGRPLPQGSGCSWREWEAELRSGDRAVLDAVQEQLHAAGAVPSRSASKLARLLPAPPKPAAGRAGSRPSRRSRRSRSAAAVVQAHLAAQVEELITRDPQARRELPDAVHKMRVATRRLRSALATFGPLLDRSRTDPLREELGWLAGALGGVRDTEVMLVRLRDVLAVEPPELMLGPVRARLETHMTQRHLRARRQLLDALNSQRYLQLLDDLDQLALAAPFRREAKAAAPPALARLLRRAWRRLNRAMIAAEAAHGARAAELLHEVRKDAKRMRYATEAVQPIFGRPATRFAGQMEALQESLDGLQDGMVTTQVLRVLGAAGHVQGENGFTLGRLHALEQVRSDSAMRAWQRTRADVAPARTRTWMQP